MATATAVATRAVADFETMKKVAVMFTRREHGVLSDVCRKYTQRDIVGEDANCLIQFDEMLAEISQQLEECSIDECPTIATSVHYTETTACKHLGIGGGICLR